MLASPAHAARLGRRSTTVTDVKFNNQGSQQTQSGARRSALRLRPADSARRERRIRGQPIIRSPATAASSTARASMAADRAHKVVANVGAPVLRLVVPVHVRSPDAAVGVERQASRNITSYPQQLAHAAGAAPVSQGLLNQLFLSRIPDPTQRQEAVEQFIQDRGLPPIAVEPGQPLFAADPAQRRTSARPSGLLGARNTSSVTVFYVTQRADRGIRDAAAAGYSPCGNNNTQLGGNLVWTHNLTPSVTLDLDA